MHCNRFIGETLVAFRQVCCSSAVAMYQEQVLSYKHLDEPLDEGRFIFEYILPDFYYM